jgi:hypothetical protein
MDVNKLAIQESIFTNHKTVTALDSTTEYVLAGLEDGHVKVYDLRKSASSTKA